MSDDPTTTPDEPDQGQRPEHDLEGQELGVYEVLRRVGRGGMGDIYLAMHTRLGGQVALKVLRPDLAMRQDVVERFFNEARAVNQIGHPNIVNIIDFIELFDQSPPLVYMVMEFLVGQDLSSLLQYNGPLDPARAVAITLEVGKALHAVHAVQILHRDLKPENIFLLDGDESGHRLKLLDFGVARMYGDQQAKSLTDPGTTIGTAEYMAPEQVNAGILDSRTDIYALGVVLYEMLSGRVPFTAGSIGGIFVKVLNEDPPPLCSEGDKESAVDPKLEAIVFRCLQKDPARRYQSARDLNSALESYLLDARTQEGVAAFRPTAQSEARGFDSQLPDDEDYLPTSRVNWKVLLIVAMVLVGAGIGLAVRSCRGTPDETPVVSKKITAPADAGQPPAAAPTPDAALPVDLPPAAAPDQAVKEPAKDPPRPKKAPPKRRVPRKKKKQGPTKKKKVDITHGTIDPFAN